MENKLAINMVSAYASNALDFQLLEKLTKLPRCYYAGLGSSS